MRAEQEPDFQPNALRPTPSQCRRDMNCLLSLPLPVQHHAASVRTPSNVEEHELDPRGFFSTEP